jgi:hypothetical protein
MVTFAQKLAQPTDDIRSRLFRFNPSDAKLEQVEIGATIKGTEEAEARARSKVIGDQEVLRKTEATMVSFSKAYRRRRLLFPFGIHLPPTLVKATRRL